MDRNILCYGMSEPLPERIPLRAGPFRLIYEQGDLRSICLGEEEILRRIYVAVRDRNWGTITPAFSNTNLSVEPECFHITYDVENHAGEIDFAWHGDISGAVDGTLTFQMEGIARSTFSKNRIGFCVLHPARLSGQKAKVEHIDGSREETQFVEDLCADQPLQPFANLRAIRHEVIPGVWAEVSFSGDIFEMEDQRLWTDASYKTFCTPLNLPYPVEIQAGTRITQKVTLKLIEEHPGDGIRAGFSTLHPPTQVLIRTAENWRPIPAIGLSVASHGQPLSEQELARLRALRLHHLRVDLQLSEPDYADRLLLAKDQAEALGIPLEVALAVDTNAVEMNLTQFHRLIEEYHPRVCGWLVFPEHEPYLGGNPSEEIARQARAILKPFDPAIPLAVGTNTDFIFLMRTRLPLDWMDQVSITLNPQVHAFDNQSLIETLEAQPLLIASARRMARGLPVIVSPITLKPRFNPYATDPKPHLASDELSAAVDPRQMSLFAAGWTLGSLRALVIGGVERVTFYETTGWRGVMAQENGSPLRDRFPAIPESVFPLYLVMALYGEFAGGQACAVSTSSPLQISCLALQQGQRTRYILANHTPEEPTVSLKGIAGEHAVCTLDETNVESALRKSDSFLQALGQRTHAQAGGCSLKLRPFGIACLDFGPPIIHRR